MLVTELGIVTDVRALQLTKALVPMLVTPCGMVIDVNLLQLLNRLLLMLVIEFESVALVKFEHPLIAL